jgi:hypothetical protein
MGVFQADFSFFKKLSAWNTPKGVFQKPAKPENF